MLPNTDKERKALPLWDFFFGYFPKSWLSVLGVAVAGNNQHNPGERLHWARGKSKDQLNTAMRHLFDYGMGTHFDTDGQRHLAKAIWRLSAQNELDIEASEKPMTATEVLASKPTHWGIYPANGLPDDFPLFKDKH